MFRCRKVSRVKDERGRGRREWTSENGMRWDNWGALASKKWVGMEESTVSTMRAGRSRKSGFDGVFFAGVHHQI